MIDQVAPGPTAPRPATSGHRTTNPYAARPSIRRHATNSFDATKYERPEPAVPGEAARTRTPTSGAGRPGRDLSSGEPFQLRGCTAGLESGFTRTEGRWGPHRARRRGRLLSSPDLPTRIPPSEVVPLEVLPWPA